MKKVDEALTIRRKRDKTVERAHAMKVIASRYEHAGNHYHNELKRRIDTMSAEELRTYLKRCQE